MTFIPRTGSLVAVMLFALGSSPLAPVEAQGVVVVRAGAGGRQQVAPGAKVAVPLVLDLDSAGGADIASLTAGVTWGSTKLTLDSIVPGSFGTLTTNMGNASSGSATVSISSATGTTSTVTGANLWFTAVAAGSTRIGLSPTVAGNGSGSDILPIIRVGDLDVCVAAGGTWGDVNLDNAVNIIDAQQIARFSVGLSVVNPGAMSANGDVNADNAVNIIDGQQVARFSVGLPASARVNTSNSTPPTAASLTIASVLQAAGGGVQPGTPANLNALPPGSQAQIRATITDAGNTDISSCATIAFSSSNGNVATVSSTGMLTAVAPGTATITVTSGSANATVNVTVSSGTVAVMNRWTNTAGGNWSQPSNWSLGRIPVTSDSVVIDLSGDYTVTLDVTFTASFITLGGGSGMQRLEIAALTLTINNVLTVKAGANLETSSATLGGSGRVVNQGRLDMTFGTINTALDNQGLVVFIAVGSFNGTFTNQAGATLQVASNSANGFAKLTIANGFTNAGTIDLTSLSGLNSVLLVVRAGTLTNAPGATILSSIGSGGGRSLDAALDNQGSIQISQNLTLQRGQGFTAPAAAHRNSGTISLTTGDFFLSQQGGNNGPDSFTNTGTITLASGRTWFATRGTINLNAGIAGGTLSLAGAALNLGTGLTFSTANTGLIISGGSVGGPGSLANASGQQLTMTGGAISAPFDNFGILTFSSGGSLNGPFANHSGATFQLNGNLFVATGFTNDGAINLASGSRLTITNGNLTNGSGGSISTGTGSTGTNVIDAVLDNSGSITVNDPLQIMQHTANSAGTNSGTIDITGADLVFQQSTFTNTGTVTIAAGRTWNVQGGTLNLAANSVAGPGLLAISGTPGTTLNLAAGFSTSASLALNGTTVNGPGTLTNPAGRTMILTSVTINTAFDNLGGAVFSGIGNFNGPFTNQGSATLQIVGGVAGNAGLTVATGFTNQGVIDLTSVTSASGSALVITSGSLTNAPGAVITASPGTGGARTITATVNNQGSISLAPGTNSTLQLGVVGDLATSGSIDLKLGGTTAISQYDRVSVTGNAALAGTLNVAAANGFVPPANTSYTILTTTGSVTGAFTTTNIAPPGIVQPPTYTVNAVILTTTAPGPAASLVFSNQPTTAAPNASIAPAIRVTALDANGNVATGYSGNITLAIGSNPGGGTLGGTTTVAASGGVATFSNISINATGNGYTLTANAAGLTTVVSAAFDIAVPPTAVNRWINTSSGNWSTASSWSLGRVPVTSDSVVIALNCGGCGVTLDVNNVTVSYITIGGAGGLNALTISGRALTVNNVLLVKAGSRLDLSSGSIGGPGRIVNESSSLNLTSSTVNTPLDNFGRVNASNGSAINGTFTNQPGATLAILAFGSSATLTVANGFANNGTITLDSSSPSFTSTLVITNGTLVNAPGATIIASPGSGGTRAINAPVDNQGLITLAPGTNTTLQLSIAGNFTTSGTIDLKIGGTTPITQYDRLSVTGNATLGGTLNVASANFFFPPSGSSYTILTTNGALSGTFATTNIAPSGIAQPPTYTTNSVVLVKP